MLTRTDRKSSFVPSTSIHLKKVTHLGSAGQKAPVHCHYIHHRTSIQDCCGWVKSIQIGCSSWIFLSTQDNPELVDVYLAGQSPLSYKEPSHVATAELRTVEAKIKSRSAPWSKGGWTLFGRDKQQELKADSYQATKQICRQQISFKSVKFFKFAFPEYQLGRIHK